jgi:hypothetical protein
MATLRRLADIAAALDEIVGAVCKIRTDLALNYGHEQKLNKKLEAARDALVDLSALLNEIARQHEAGNERQLPGMETGRREGPDG